MNTLFTLVDRKTGKKIAQSTTLAHVFREGKWRGAKIARDGFDLFKIVRVEREGWNGWNARSDRFGSVWPDAKCQDFSTRYLRGDLMRDLCAYFDCEHTGIRRICRKLGLPSRISSEMLAGKAGGAWLPEQDELINFLMDEGMTPDEIAQHLERTKGSVVRRIVQTENQFSSRYLTKDRRQAGHRYPTFGKEALRRTLEKCREHFGDFRRGRQSRQNSNAPLSAWRFPGVG